MLILGWTAFYGVIGLSNASDVVATVAGLAPAWRSGNVAWARSALGFVGKPLWLAVAIVLMATVVELVSALLYLRAAARMARGENGALGAVRAATAPGVALWFSFIVGLELFLAFTVVDWSKFLLLIVAMVVTLLIAERHLAPERA